MNRRGFCGAMGALVGGFMILPPATTYQRIWKATINPPLKLVPFWHQTKRVTSYQTYAYAKAFDAMIAERRVKGLQPVGLYSFMADGEIVLRT